MLLASTIRVTEKNRVAYPFAQFAKGGGIARSASALLLLMGTALVHAQSAPCGITSIKEQSQLVYPPITRAAHVEGAVILLTRFDSNGLPVHINVLSGPKMLQGEAVEFVKGWRTNEYTGPRECPITIEFSFVGPPPAECGTDQLAASFTTKRLDLQHFTITTQNACFTVIRDPAGLRVHNFLGHRWYSNP